jgi:hypothetical protein
MSPKVPGEPPVVNNVTARNAGILLVAVTVLAVAAMTRHPSVTSSDITQVIEQIARMSGLSAWVHGVMIGVLLVLLYVFTEFAWRRGITLPLVRTGLIAYFVGVLAMMSAAMVSGFVITQTASLTSHANDADLRILGQLLILCGVLNQTFASLGVLLMSAGIVFWSLDLWRGPRLARLLGMFGLLVGLLPPAALAFGALHLNVPGMTQVVLLQLVWNIGIGVLLIRGIV